MTQNQRDSLRGEKSVKNRYDQNIAYIYGILKVSILTYQNPIILI